MEMIAKFAVFLTMGLALLVCNVWFVTTAIRSFSGKGNFVVAPVKVTGKTGDAALAGEAMARSIIAHWQTRDWDLQESQAALAPEQQAPSVTGVATGIVRTPKIAVLDVQLFEPPKFDVKVAGVDVGGLLPGIQRWLVQDRTLSFAVSWDGNTAIVAGNVDALGLGRAKPLLLPIADASENSVADAIALALIQRLRAKEIPEYSQLDEDEFGKLADSISESARINRRVLADKVSAKGDFHRVLANIGPVADRMVGWNGLASFVASIAEGAEDYERALVLYRRVLASTKSAPDAAKLQTKISTLEGLAALASKTAPDKDQVALAKLKGHVKDATGILNQYFKTHLAEPSVKLTAEDFRNAYWDGKLINAPSRVQNIPDIMYHETAWPFIQSVWKSFIYVGQEGALVMSYTDVLTSVVKQKLRNQTAQNADWVIAPGAIAWLAGKSDSNDQHPLRSMKAPGTAYEDPVIGKDLQIDHYSKLAKGSDDLDSVHINSGIMNRAFYETAMRIGTDKAAEIWIASLANFKPSMNFRSASKIIVDTAVKSYGEGSDEAKAVKAGFNVVGL